MELTNFQWYIIGINIAAFIIYVIDYFIFMHGGSGIKPAVLCNLVTVFGGAFGTLIAETLCQRHINKFNVQSRLYTFVWLVIQLLFFWMIWGPNRERFFTTVKDFYNTHKVLCIYYLAINIITFIAFAVDKVKAMLGKYRIPEAVLLGLCLMGGGLGGYFGMDFLNHKVHTMAFMAGVPVTMCVHLVLLLLIVMKMI